MNFLRRVFLKIIINIIIISLLVFNQLKSFIRVLNSYYSQSEKIENPGYQKLDAFMFEGRMLFELKFKKPIFFNFSKK